VRSDPATARLRFLGACGTVTGSRFLLESDQRILVDCGLFQGERSLRRRNWTPMGIDADLMDAVVLTHAHLDHTGYLPVLVREGFAGPAIASPDTCRLTSLVLRDSAHLQVEDAAYARAHHLSKHDPPRPLYDESDAEAAISVLRGVDVRVATDVAGAVVTLRPAGHILGSTTAEIRLGGRTVLLTGDLGRPHHPLLAPPAPRPAADVVVVESTYGDRRHPPDETDRLAATIRGTLAGGGSVLVPAFAVDRTEIVLRLLRVLRQKGAIPAAPDFVDSPMALAALRIYSDALAGGATDVRGDLGADPLGLGWVRLAATVEESMDLNSPAEPAIIVSASGMASGGRVVHHLAALAQDTRNTVVLVGFQAPGTRGAALADGERVIKALGRYVTVRARVEAFHGLSVHADADDLVAWLAGPAGAEPPPPSVCFVVHGQASASATLARRLHDELGWLAVVPDDGELVRLD
jgi:metallo-beta-lactamase family protein